MDIVEINEHIRKLKCEETNWQSVEKLAALCTVRNELSEAESRENSPDPQPEQVMQMEYSTRPQEPQSEFVEAASAVPFSVAVRLDRRGVKVSVTTIPAAASAAVLPEFWIRKV